VFSTSREGWHNQMIRKAALQTLAFALLGCIAWNAYMAVKQLTETQRTGAVALENSKIKAEISGVLRDLTDMETGQRGYLLTADASYLQPYSEAKARIETDFSSLRSGLAHRPEREQSLESQLESVAHSKQAEMERTINMRQEGYRHRAFKLVDSNEGMEYMSRARELLSELSMAEASRFTQFDNARSGSLRKALVSTAIVNLCLVVLAACLLGLMRYHARMLDKETAESKKELAIRDSQLSRLTSILSNQARSTTSVIEANARLLLESYGGFLPRKGHECAEQIKDASAEMESLRQELVCSPGNNGDHRAA
jgi:CHASE3 domain sensor protein